MSKASITINELFPIMEEAFNQGKSITMPINGESMLPTLNKYTDIIELTPTDTIEKYDIVLYLRDNGQFVLHRAVKIYDNRFNALGDGQSLIEKNIPQSSIKAVLTSYKRNGKEKSINTFRHKFYIYFWRAIRPFRRLLLLFYKAFFYAKHTKNK